MDLTLIMLGGARHVHPTAVRRLITPPASRSGQRRGTGDGQRSLHSVVDSRIDRLIVVIGLFLVQAVERQGRNPLRAASSSVTSRVLGNARRFRHPQSPLLVVRSAPMGGSFFLSNPTRLPARLGSVSWQSRRPRRFNGTPTWVISGRKANRLFWLTLVKSLPRPH